MGQTSNPSLVWKKGRFQINDDDDDDDDDGLYLTLKGKFPFDALNDNYEMLAFNISASNV